MYLLVFLFVYTWLIFWGNLFWMRFKNKLLPVKGDRRDHFSSHLDLYSSFCNWRVGVPKVEEKVVRGYRHYRTWNFMRLAGKKIRTCFIQACILVSDFSWKKIQTTWSSILDVVFLLFTCIKSTLKEILKLDWKSKNHYVLSYVVLTFHGVSLTSNNAH